MPTYDYRCPAGHDFERFYRKISEAPAELECAVCGAVAERRVSGGAGLLFKGSGFYLTDYGKNAHRKQAPDAKKPDGKAGEKAGAETGPAAAKSESGAAGAGAGDTAAKSETPAPKPKDKSSGGE